MMGIDWGVNFCVVGFDRNCLHAELPGGGALNGRR